MKTYTHMFTEYGKYPLSAFHAVFRPTGILIVTNDTYEVIRQVESVVYGNNDDLIFVGEDRCDPENLTDDVSESYR